MLGELMGIIIMMGKKKKWSSVERNDDRMRVRMGGGGGMKAVLVMVCAMQVLQADAQFTNPKLGYTPNFQTVQDVINMVCSFNGMDNDCDLSGDILFDVSCSFSFDTLTYGTEINDDNDELIGGLGFFLLFTPSPCANNGVCSPEACTYGAVENFPGYSCPYPTYNADAKKFKDFFQCRNLTNDSTYFLSDIIIQQDGNYIPIPDMSAIDVNSFQTALTEDGYQLSEFRNTSITTVPWPLIPDCCDCNENYTKPLCLLEKVPIIPSKETGGITALVIVIIAVSGVLAAVIIVLVAFWRFRNTELYMRSMELHQKRSRPPMYPGETVTFAWTDITASTSLWEANPMLMDKTVALHFQVLRSLLRKHNGYESMTEGDALFAVFHDENDAISWALNVQRFMMYPEGVLGGSEFTKGMTTNLFMDRKTQRKDWSNELLKYDDTCEIHGIDDTLLFRGPKVRIGIHSGVLKNEGGHQDERSLEEGKASQSESSISSPASSGMATFNVQTQNGNTRASSDGKRSKPVKGNKSQSWIRAFNRIMGTGKKKSPSKSNDSISSMLRGEESRRDTAFADVNMRQGRFRYWGTACDISKMISDLPSGGLIITTGSCISHASLNDLDELMILLPVDLTERLKIRDVKPIKQPGQTQVSPGLFQAPGFQEEWAKDCYAIEKSVYEIGDETVYPADKKHIHTISKLKSIKRNLPSNVSNRLSISARSKRNFLPKVAIVFVMVHGKHSILNESKQLAWNSLLLFVQCVRDQLSLMDVSYHDGYECEENDGDFVISFRKPHLAILFSTNLQQRLMEVNWPTRLLDLDVAAEMYAPHALRKSSIGNIDQIDSATSPNSADTNNNLTILYRGLRCRIGILYNTPQAIRPHASSGRAAYFGMMMNRCARICKLASPGQILCDYDTWLESVYVTTVSQGENSTAIDEFSNKKGDLSNSINLPSDISDDSSVQVHDTEDVEEQEKRKHISIPSHGLFNRNNNQDRAKEELGKRHIIEIPKHLYGGPDGEMTSLIGIDLGKHKLKGIQKEIGIMQCSNLALELRPIPLRFARNAMTETLPQFIDKKMN